MTAAHLVRPGAKRRKQAPPLPTKDYPAGFLSALVVQHNWPPSFRPQTLGASVQRLQQAAQASRQHGNGFEANPLGLPGALEHVKRWKAGGA